MPLSTSAEEWNTYLMICYSFAIQSEANDGSLTSRNKSISKKMYKAGPKGKRCRTRPCSDHWDWPRCLRASLCDEQKELQACCSWAKGEGMRGWDLRYKCTLLLEVPGHQLSYHEEVRAESSSMWWSRLGACRQKCHPEYAIPVHSLHPHRAADTPGVWQE